MSQNDNPIIDRHLQPGQFYGTILDKHNFAGLTLSELKHKERRKLPQHSHELGYFCFLIDGSYSEYYAGKTFNYRPLTIMFHPPGLVHRDEIGAHGGHFFSVEIGSDWMKRLGEYSTVPETIIDFESGDLAWLALRLYREFKTLQPSSDLAVEGLVMTMLAELTRTQVTNEKRPPKWLSRAIDLLHDEFQQNLTVTHIAAEVGIHPFHLAKVFRQYHRQTVGDFLKRLRVKFAIQELFKPEIELASLAIDAGFADQSHFTRVFRQVTGVTPGAFRAAIKRRSQITQD